MRRAQSQALAHPRSSSCDRSGRCACAALRPLARPPAPPPPTTTGSPSTSTLPLPSTPSAGPPYQLRRAVPRPPADVTPSHQRHLPQLTTLSPQQPPSPPAPPPTHGPRLKPHWVLHTLQHHERGQGRRPTSRCHLQPCHGPLHHRRPQCSPRAGLQGRRRRIRRASRPHCRHTHRPPSPSTFTMSYIDDLTINIDLDAHGATVETIARVASVAQAAAHRHRFQLNMKPGKPRRPSASQPRPPHAFAQTFALWEAPSWPPAPPLPPAPHTLLRTTRICKHLGSPIPKPTNTPHEAQPRAAQERHALSDIRAGMVRRLTCHQRRSVPSALVDGKLLYGTEDRTIPNPDHLRPIHRVLHDLYALSLAEERDVKHPEGAS